MEKKRARDEPTLISSVAVNTSTFDQTAHVNSELDSSARRVARRAGGIGDWRQLHSPTARWCV